MDAQFFQVASLFLARIKAEDTKVNQVVQEIVPQAKKWIEAGTSLVRTWTGSYCGYHCELYFREFEHPSLRDRFSPEWGGINGIPDGWALRSHEEVKER